MIDRLRFILIALIALIALIPSYCTGQSIPVPEYFGIYAVVNGHLVKLDEPKVQAEKYVTVSMGRQNEIANIQNGQATALPPEVIRIPEFPPDLKIVVFAESSGLNSPLGTAQMLHLTSLVFVRNLNVDTGPPNNVRRSSSENGWESGNAAEFAVLPDGNRAQDLELLIKPMPGQKDMVIAGFADRLKPGIYRLSFGPEDMLPPSPTMLFAVQPVTQGEMNQCVDASVSYMLTLSNTKYARCSGASSTNFVSSDNSGAVANTSGEPQSAGTGQSATCSGYNGCFNAGLRAYQSGDWSGATAAFRAASKANPTNGQPWYWLGIVMLKDGQIRQADDLARVWDKALSLGSNLIISGCHERTLQPCERGDLWLSPKSVSFRVRGAQQVFEAAPSEIEPGRILNNSAAEHIAYSLKVARKNYSIDFIPSTWTTCKFNLMVQCPSEGTVEQLILAQYVSETLPKLASGALKANVPPVSPSARSTNPAPTTPMTNSACNRAVDSGYAILLQGHLYKVRLAGSAGPNREPYFFDERGTQVTDSSLLSQLASAVWTHDNVIASPDARNGSTRVSDVLGTSKALQRYTTLQDLLARAMVEAIEAGATGGASLSKAVPNLTFGILKAQLLNAPKTLLTLSAQRGLESSLAAYRQMEGIPLPPPDATAFNATDLAHIKELYFQARSLELPYEALAAKLMPTTGSDLTTQALKSALGEVTAGPLFSHASSEAVTLQDLLKLQTSIANLDKSLPALQNYNQNLNLAANLTNANNETISKWASTAGQKCN